jgi:hypothetical protein
MEAGTLDESLPAALTALNKSGLEGKSLDVGGGEEGKEDLGTRR